MSTTQASTPGKNMYADIRTFLEKTKIQNSRVLNFANCVGATYHDNNGDQCLVHVERPKAFRGVALIGDGFIKHNDGSIENMPMSLLSTLCKLLDCGQVKNLYNPAINTLQNTIIAVNDLFRGKATGFRIDTHMGRATFYAYAKNAGHELSYRGSFYCFTELGRDKHNRGDGPLHRLYTVLSNIHDNIRGNDAVYLYWLVNDFRFLKAVGLGKSMSEAIAEVSGRLGPIPSVVEDLLYVSTLEAVLAE